MHLSNQRVSGRVLLGAAGAGFRVEYTDDLDGGPWLWLTNGVLSAERQDVILQVVVPAPVPTVRGDPERLGQVLINLVHNAVKFSPDGGAVTVTVRADGETVVVSVEDHGVGIPRAAQDRIFERFYKVDRARVRGETGGTGLGLAIARHVIEQHHGRIWVASYEGVGSTFSFALPT